MSIICGKYSSANKSACAIRGVVESLSASLDTHAGKSLEEAVLADVRSAIESDAEYALIDSERASILLPYLEKWHHHLGAELGFPDPQLAPQLDSKAGLDSLEAKWGAGKGWQYLCGYDLINACRESLGSGEPVCICWV